MADTDMQTPSVDMTDDPIGKPKGQHPYWQDLNPDFLKGENYGDQGPHPEKTSGRNAYSVKGVSDLLPGWNAGDLQQVPIMPTGSRLEQGATYIDLRAAQRQELTATGNMEAGEDNWYVPKSEVPYWLWNRLIGIENPERRDAAGER